MMIESRIRLNAAVTIGTTSTYLGTLTGIIGARTITLRFSGGSNTSNALSAVAVIPLDGSGDRTKTTGGQTWISAPDFADGAAVKPMTNRALPDGGFLHLYPDDLQPCFLPSLAIYATMATAQSTGVVVDAWVYMDADENITTRHATLP